MLNIAVAGASGRMGQMLIKAVLDAPDLKLSGAFDIAGSALIGADAGAGAGLNSGVTVVDSIERGIDGADCLIDFTRPAGTLAHLRAAGSRPLRFVIGTTGFDDAALAQIRLAAQSRAIVLAPNMSVGVNVTLKLLELAARALAGDYDVEIYEAHHRHKVDAPSGTALRMGEVIAEATGRRLADCMVPARHGQTGERVAGTIGFAVSRGGDIVGDHTAMFAGTGERIEITHRSSSRDTYAQGSLRAARFLAGKPSGLFDMQDVLDLRDRL